MSRRSTRRTPAPHTTAVCAGLLAWLVLSPFQSAITLAETLTPSRVLLFTPDAHDPRIDDTAAAIAFWNRTFDELGLPAPLGQPEIVVASPSTRSLENYAWQISRSAGRLVPGAPGPPAPDELVSLDVQVVVLLSSQKLMPFAWPWDDERSRHFVGIAAPDEPGADELRNVVAHELGHVLGLTHDRSSPATLMCQPCAGETPGSDTHFRPLTPKDRERLRELHRSER